MLPFDEPIESTYDVIRQAFEKHLDRTDYDIQVHPEKKDDGHE